VEKEHEEDLRMTVEQILSPRTNVKQIQSPDEQNLDAMARIQALVCAHLDQRDSHARAWWQLNSHLVRETECLERVARWAIAKNLQCTHASTPVVA
jgi:hypothetical protein